MTAPHIALFAFGPARVEVQGQTVDLGLQKASALFHYLALTRRAHTRTALSGLLWPEVGPEQRLGSLRNALWRVRSVLGGNVVEVSREAVGLCANARVWVDVHEFEMLVRRARAEDDAAEATSTLRAAIDLARGELLEDLRADGCPLLDEWRTQLALRLRADLAAGLRRLSAALARQALWSEALATAVRFTAMEPLDEDGHRAIMRLYVHAGRRAEAVKQFTLCAAALSRDLGIQPSPETRALHQAIIAGTPLRGSPWPNEPGAAAAGSAPELDLSGQAAPLLPPMVMPLVGREGELAAVEMRLRSGGCRLLTLTGLSGVGKSALALALAHRHAARHPGCACWVALDAASGMPAVVTALADALSLPPALTEEGDAQVIEALRRRRMLLVLDGCDGPGAPEMIRRLLLGCPEVQVLATARRRLDMRAEWEVALCGLDATSGAVMLARCAERVGVPLRAEDSPAVARIVEIVSGLPLALDLCGAALRHAAPWEIANRLSHDLDFLRAPGDAPERHRSLRAAYATWVAALPAEQRAALRALSLFRDGARAEAACAVAAVEPDVLEDLRTQMLTRSPSPGRVVLHGVVRAYAAMELDGSAETAQQIERRYVAWFRARAVEWRSQLAGARGGAALREIDADSENLRAAARFALTHGDPTAAAEVTEALAAACELRGRFVEAEKLIAQILPHVTPTLDLLRCRLLAVRAHALAQLGRLAEAAGCAQAALAAVPGALAPAAAPALQAAGAVALARGDLLAASFAFETLGSLAVRTGDVRAGAAASLGLGQVATRRGELAAATAALLRAADAFAALDDTRGLARAMAAMGEAWSLAGDPLRADAALREAQRMLGTTEAPHERARGLCRLGVVLVERGELEAAAASLSSALEIGRLTGAPDVCGAAHLGLGRVALAQEDRAAAGRCFADAIAEARRAPGGELLADALAADGHLAALSGDTERAAQRLAAALGAALEARSVPAVAAVLVRAVEIELGEHDAPPVGVALQAAARSPIVPAPVRARAERALKRLGAAPRDGAEIDLTTAAAGAMKHLFRERRPARAAAGPANRDEPRGKDVVRKPARAPGKRGEAVAGPHRLGKKTGGARRR